LSPSSALSHLTPRPSLFRPSRPLTLCLPIVGACYRCLDCSFLQCVWDYASLPSLPFSLPPPGLPHSGAALQVSGVQLLHCMWGHTSVSSPPFSLPPPGLPHSGGALQLP
ncbi:unnamed protein product, partial [Closterium sp. NIES-65]